MPELVIYLPDDVVQDLYDEYAERVYLWDYVQNEGHDIIALFFDVGAFPRGIEEYYFADSVDARDEAWRLNKEMGLTDDEIVQRIDDVMKREKAWTQGSNLQWPDDPDEMIQDACRKIDSGESTKGH